MDLKLLPHLSDRALRQEAERRGVDVEGLDRDALIAAIRDREARAVTGPPSEAPTADEPRGERPMLGAARALLGRVVGLARSALDRRSTPPEEPAPAPSEEPIRTRSMARLLEQQGHPERALAIVRELSQGAPEDRELAAWAERLAPTVAQRALQERAHAWLENGAGVHILSSGSARAVVWRVDEASIERARALLGARGLLTLRVIRVLALPDLSVETTQEDRRPLEASGWAVIDSPLGARLVISVGVAEGERFVSVAHAAA